MPKKEDEFPKEIFKKQGISEEKLTHDGLFKAYERLYPLNPQIPQLFANILKNQENESNHELISKNSRGAIFFFPRTISFVLILFFFNFFLLHGLYRFNTYI